jgi:trehalose 6-phosphate phosphatase
MWDKILGNDYSIALLLDVDGTLLELAATPEEVHVPPELPPLLDELAMRLDGALALVSGRPLDDLDRLFSPYRFCGAGMHGCDIRDASGRRHRVPFDPHLVETVHAECVAFADDAEGLLIEHKTFGVAIHYRLAPAMEDRVHRFATSLAARFANDFVMQPGKCVCEIRPAQHSKGTAILSLSKTAPFRGRKPIFLGDDVADEAGFGVVNSLGGASIRVGGDAPTLAQHTARDPNEVRRLLSRLCAELGEPAASLR